MLGLTLQERYERIYESYRERDRLLHVYITAEWVATKRAMVAERKVKLLQKEINELNKRNLLTVLQDMWHNRFK